MPLRKAAFAVLAAAPFVVAGLVAAVPLRADGLHVPVGILAFAMIAAFVFPFVRSGARSEDGREMAIAGVLFFLPFMLFALLWVGIATPYHASPAENLMRIEVPGVLAGIPAMPWLMPCLLGVVLLRRSASR